MFTPSRSEDKVAKGQLRSNREKKKPKAEAKTAQTKELTELAQKVTTEIAVKDWRHGDTKQS